MKGRGDGQQKDNYETVLGVFRIFFNTEYESMIKIQTSLSESPLRSVWMDETGDAKPDSGLGHTQDYRTRYTDDDWTFTQQTEQPAGRKRRAGGRPAVNHIPEEMVVHRDSWWDIPRKRALFTSDGPDSTTSGSDIPEGYADRPSEYSEGLISRRPHDDDRLYSPSIDLEKAVIQLQKEVNDCRTELELARKQTPAVALRPPRQSGFTSTPVPRYSGESNWEQYREVFEAIVSSNGWDGVTAALQLLSHLDGDALNVALLVPESRRVVPGFLIKSLSEHYNAPGRLAGYKRQFQWAFRRPGDDPSIFAIELETLARRAFIDIDTSIQLKMVRDRFIDGQAECALRRHLDSLGPNTPMADIVDCCRVWERHREVESTPWMSTDGCPAHAICQITEDEPAPAASPETGNWANIIRKLLPTPALPPAEAARYRQSGRFSSSN